MDALAYNPTIAKLDMPARIAALPIDKRGYPVPKFVSWIDGEPDFRVVDYAWLQKATTHGFCFMCGERLGRHKAFTIGPMCAINRISSEPPSHVECATFAVKACPFMLHPQRPRDRRTELPAGNFKPGGEMIERNPGVSLIWVTDTWRLQREGDKVMFRIGDPSLLGWWTRGRHATRAEIMASIESGLPILREMAERQGPEAVAALERMTRIGLALVPDA